MSVYAKEFLAIYFAFKEFGHISPSVIIPIDNKLVTRFFETTNIPPPLWNAYDFVIEVKFIIPHNPGKNNTSADYLSRMEMDSNEKLILNIREDVDQPRSMSNQLECPKRSKSFLLKRTMRRKNRFGNERNYPKRDSRSMSQ